MKLKALSAFLGCVFTRKVVARGGVVWSVVVAEVVVPQGTAYAWHTAGSIVGTCGMMRREMRRVVTKCLDSRICMPSLARLFLAAMIAASCLVFGLLVGDLGFGKRVACAGYGAGCVVEGSAAVVKQIWLG